MIIIGVVILYKNKKIFRRVELMSKGFIRIIKDYRYSVIIGIIVGHILGEIIF